MIFFSGKRRVRELEDLNRELSQTIATLRIKLIAANVKIALLKKAQGKSSGTRT